MITANLESLRDRIVSRVPLCPAAFVMAYLRQAASQFFRESEIWRYTFEDIDIVANQATYELAFPAAMATGVELVRIDYAEESGVALPWANTIWIIWQRGLAIVTIWFTRRITFPRSR